MAEQQSQSRPDIYSLPPPRQQDPAANSDPRQLERRLLQELYFAAQRELAGVKNQLRDLEILVHSMHYHREQSNQEQAQRSSRRQAVLTALAVLVAISSCVITLVTGAITVALQLVR